MLFRDFLFCYKNFHISLLEKRKFFKLLKIGFSLLYKFIFLELFLYNFFYKKNLDKLSISQSELFNKDLTFLFEHFDSLKIEHKYSSFYHENLKEIKDKELNILEIGTAKGDGLASFYFYFPKSKIIGVDNNPFRMRYKSKRIRNIYVDISSKTILENLSKHINQKFDLIIDDCSHRLIDQIFCFSENFENLKEGGIYIVEDLNFPEMHEMYNPTNEDLDLKTILQQISRGKRISSKFIDKNKIEYIEKNIKNIKFYSGQGKYSEIVFIKKK